MRGIPILELLHRSETRLDIVVVHGRVTVIGSAGIGSGVPVNGRHPDAGHAKVFQIVQMIAHAAKVPAMIPRASSSASPATAGTANILIGCHVGLRRRIIRRIAIGEPVRHEQVNHIVRTKTLEPAPGFQRTIQSQLKFASPEAFLT